MADNPNPFRLFDLPSELRVRIYEYALAPSGVLCLTSTKSKRFAVDPIATPALLATSRQVRSECDNILFSENQVCISVNAHDTCWPTISETRLPQRVLQRIQHLCVILDCTDYFNASYADVDFAAFEALVALKSLRLAMLYRKNYPSQVLAPLHIANFKGYNVIAQILERVPANTKLSFGTVPGSPQNGAVWRVLDERLRSRGGTIVEASPESLETAANGVKDLVRGCKSGKAEDVYAKSRAQREKFIPQRV